MKQFFRCVLKRFEKQLEFCAKTSGKSVNQYVVDAVLPNM